jgi:sugar-specific transcriptional regulator TrmB
MKIENLLQKLGIEEKEQSVYLSLVDSGTLCAASISQKIGIPKSSVLFLCEKLLKKGVIERSYRGKVQYFLADPNLMQKAVEQEISEKSLSLKALLPILEERKNTFSLPPKVLFFEGVDSCKQAYLKTLEEGEEILEFGDYSATEKTFGKKFMQNFIEKRKRQKIFSKSIGKKDDQTSEVQKNDPQEMRETRFYDSDIGMLFSVVNIFGNDKVLLLNPGDYPFAILIHNKEFFQTMKTIHAIIWEQA